MALIDHIVGFEVGNLSIEGPGTNTVTGSVAIESVTVRSGAKSLKVTPASGAVGRWSGGVTVITSGCLRFSVRVTVLPGTARLLVAGGAGAAGLLLNPDGSLSFVDAGGVTRATTTTKLTDTSRWYMIQVLMVASVCSVAVEGATEMSGLSAGSFVMGFGANDTVAATYTAFFDDVAIGDSGLIGRGKALLLLPVSDNARTGWTAGAGGTTNLWDAVNNIPPVGTASASETNTTQIKDAVSSATDNYDANVNDYTAAGVPAWAIVNAVQAIARVGTENTAGGAKNGGLAIVSNPATGETAFQYDQAGAVAAEVSANWANVRATAVQTPTVTLGTKPVLRVGKRTASTRAVDVDLMGLYVDYNDTISQTMLARLESSQKLAVTGSTPFESNRKLTQTAQGPYEATKKLTQTLAAALSALKQLAVTVLEPLESSTTASGIAQTAAVVIDALKAIIKTSAGPGESLQPVSRQAGNPAETAQAVTKATLEPAEATQKRAQTMAAPGEAGKTVTAALADPVEAAKRIAATEPTTVEALSVVEATAAAAPAEAGQTVASSEQTPLEAGEGVAGTATADVDAAQALAVAAAAPAETTAAVVATGDASPLETLTTAAATADAPLSALQRLQQTAAVPLEVLGPVLTSISQTATVVVDALERLTLRATAPLEPGSRVSRTVALWIDGRRRRRRSEAVLTGKDGMISADSSSNEADTSAGGIS